ncbi:MAG: hypothetical protein IKW81_02640 [Pseudobutyrivibrio sp.]|nr:hypothetical protein [Pseudobutyrivibrio sp.]
MTKINSLLGKLFMLCLALTLSLTMVGCGQNQAGIDKLKSKLTASTTIEDDETPTAVLYFTKGVYANYAAELENPEKTYFYVFHGDGTGSIEDGEVGTATYFEYQVGYNSVTFTIGTDEPIEEEFKVTSSEDGKVIGSFDDGIELVFEHLNDVDVDTFNAVNYVHAARGEDFTYTDANGWQVRYNPEFIQVNQGGPVTTFVYTGECAGTNMITVTYTVDNNGEGAIKAIGEGWGDKTTYTESIFPGTEDVKGYWAVCASEEGDSGLYMTAIARDYMDGALVFEFTEHHSGDEMIDIAVSDYLAAIIDSLEFLN